MRNFFHSRPLYIGTALSVIVAVILMANGFSNRNTETLITTTIETGSVRELVSVSGIAEAEQTAELAFPVAGIVQEVLVKTGSEVQTGDPLVILDSRAVYADRLDAYASLARAEADRDELLQGPTLSARDVTAELIATKEESLQTISNIESQKIANAYRTLLSTDLTAYSLDPEEDATPPVISGTYNCENEGVYEIEVFSSKADSGYSYKLTGLETGTYVVSTEQPTIFGDCGLRIQFDSASIYSRSTWMIDIPNMKSSLYVTNRNAYSLAITQAESAITNAEQALISAQADATNQNAPARSESIARANASIAQAKARLSRIDSQIADRTLTAPFAGVITEIDILPGETVSISPIVTLLASDEFEVTARIPEIDIGKLLTGQRVEMLFDARSNEMLGGEISFISLKSTEIDGVAYYEAIIQLDAVPQWIRSGLNADIEIIISEKTDGLRIPKRFVTKTETGYEVLLQQNGNVASSTIEVTLEGNDGYYAITGLSVGDIIVAP